jgi:plastocyanin domain-containing protein
MRFLLAPCSPFVLRASCSRTTAAFVAALVSVAALSAGCAKKAATSDTGGSAAPAAGAIAITADDKGFTPSSVTLKKGVPATLVFTRTSDDTCATEVVFPQLDVKKDLPKGTPVVINVPTDKAQTLTFQCGMGMYKSSVVVAAN